ERVEVEEDVVGQADGDLVLGGAGHLDAGDLLELSLLLVHVVADGRADGRPGRRARYRAGAGVARLVADDRAAEGPGRRAAARAVLGFAVRIVGVGAGGAAGDEDGGEKKDGGFANHVHFQRRKTGRHSAVPSCLCPGRYALARMWISTRRLSW